MDFFRRFAEIALVLVLILGCIHSSPEAPEIAPEDLEKSQEAPGLFYSYTMGDYYKIYVSLPRTYSEKSSQRYPVIYLLDADWYFDGSHERISNGGVEGIVTRLAENGEIPESILIGIGYPREIKRGRDFLTSYTHFYKFLKDELVPFIDKTYHAHEEGRTLIGHSDGGFFTTYTLFRYPDSVFTNFIAISGDFTKLDRYLFTEETSLYRRAAGIFPVTVYMAVGDQEEERFVTSTKEMAETLKMREYTEFYFTFKIYHGLHHGSVVAPAIEDGLLWIVSH
ncbi:MAG: esterase family protein [Theionarchaea archaeon]|nr:esterase family protein [Theionarchaea archaeon]